MNYDAVIRVVPFLSAFPNLQRVFFGGRWIDGEIATFSAHGSHGMIRNEYEEESSNIHTLMDNISGSFQSAGGLLKSVQVMGLRCPHSVKNGNDDNESECKVCIRACKSFPLDQVINFDNEGSSDGFEGLFRCKKTHCLDVCLSRSVIESIVEERPGGRDILRSNARLLHLLGKGSMSEIRSDDGESLFIVRYTVKEKAELKRVIEYAELDAKNICGEDVTKAIWCSFTKGDGRKVPPKSQCYLSRSSLKLLIDEMGLPIGKEDFGLEAARVENLPQIIKGVNGIRTRSHCFYLLRLVLEKLGEGASATILKVVDN